MTRIEPFVHTGTLRFLGFAVSGIGSDSNSEMETPLPLFPKTADGREPEERTRKEGGFLAHFGGEVRTGSTSYLR